MSSHLALEGIARLRVIFALILGITSAAGAQVTYTYPQQRSSIELLNTDPKETLLTNGRAGIEGPDSAWGAWDAKNLIVDWDLGGTRKIASLTVTIRHPQPNSGATHPDKLRIFVERDDKTFSSTPDLEREIPFEGGTLQISELDLSYNKLIARRVRTEFVTTGHQIVLSEVKFDAVPAPAGAKPRGLVATTAPANSAPAEPAPPAAGGVTYNYPDQPSKADLLKTDSAFTLLSDGNAFSDGPACVWGAWNVQPLLVDWAFNAPVRITSIDVAIAHPDPATENSHAGGLLLFGGDASTPFFELPDAKLTIPFEAGALQKVTLQMPEGGIVVSRLRTQFEAAKFQVVLSEVTFHTTPATAEELAAATQTRQGKQPPKLNPVSFLPAPLPAKTAPANSMFGFCGHAIHTDLFFPKKFGPEWRIERTLPFLLDAQGGWVREPIYQPWFIGDDADVAKENGLTIGENRRTIEAVLSQYQSAGVKVILTPMFGPTSDTGFTPFLQYVGELAARFPCVAVVELHNEPNLKGFWTGSVKDYVDAVKAATPLVKSKRADVPVIVGSFAGWGSSWEHPDLVARDSSDAALATAWARDALALGLLDGADGVAAHPYRNSSAPEGGLHIESAKDPSGFEKEIAGFEKLLAQHRPAGSTAIKLYFTEIGFSSGTSGHVALGSVERQADYLSRLMLLMLNMRLAGTPLEAVCWYDLKCDGADPKDGESNFGLIDVNAGAIRPGYLASRRINETFNDVSDLSRIDLQRTFSNGEDVVKSFAWKRASDGAILIPFWRMNQLQPVDADFPSELLLSLPAGFELGAVKLIDLQEDRPREIGFALEGSTLRLPVNVRARASWLEIMPRSGR